MRVNPLAGSYAATRLAALAAKLDSAEVSAVERARRRLSEVFDFDDWRAAAEATRCLLLQRDRAVHSAFAVEAEAGFVADLVASVDLEFESPLNNGDAAGSGVLIVALHYGPYSSLGSLVLERLAVHDRLPPVTFLIDSAYEPGLVGMQARSTVLARAGVVSSRGLQLLDRRAQGQAGVIRRMLDTLSRGEAVVILPDAALVPPTSRGSMRCRLGRGYVGVSRGIEWLANAAGCRVMRSHIEPVGNGHRAVVRPATSARAAVQVLLDEVVTPSPAPWAAWLGAQPEAVFSRAPVH